MEDEIGAAFDALAGHYDDNDEHAHIAGALVRLLVPAPAGFLVDVATGTGAAAFAALQVLGPAASSRSISLPGCLASPGSGR
jgi:ubiquinone/menaquinone biosynthesis C-methylase UbiE